MSRRATIALNVLIAFVAAFAVGFIGGPLWAGTATGLTVYYLRDAVDRIEAIPHPDAPVAWVIHKHAAGLALVMVAAAGIMGGFLLAALVLA